MADTRNTLQIAKTTFNALNNEYATIRKEVAGVLARYEAERDIEDIKQNFIRIENLLEEIATSMQSESKLHVPFITDKVAIIKHQIESACKAIKEIQKKNTLVGYEGEMQRLQAYANKLDQIQAAYINCMNEKEARQKPLEKMNEKLKAMDTVHALTPDELETISKNRTAITEYKKEWITINDSHPDAIKTLNSDKVIFDLINKCQLTGDLFNSLSNERQSLLETKTNIQQKINNADSNNDIKLTQATFSHINDLSNDIKRAETTLKNAKDKMTASCAALATSETTVTDENLKKEIEANSKIITNTVDQCVKNRGIIDRLLKPLHTHANSIDGLYTKIKQDHFTYSEHLKKAEKICQGVILLQKMNTVIKAAKDTFNSQQIEEYNKCKNDFNEYWKNDMENSLNLNFSIAGTPITLQKMYENLDSKMQAQIIGQKQNATQNLMANSSMSAQPAPVQPTTTTTTSTLNNNTPTITTNTMTAPSTITSQSTASVTATATMFSQQNPVNTNVITAKVRTEEEMNNMLKDLKQIANGLRFKATFWVNTRDNDQHLLTSKFRDEMKKALKDKFKSPGDKLGNIANGAQKKVTELESYQKLGEHNKGLLQLSKAIVAYYKGDDAPFNQFKNDYRHYFETAAELILGKNKKEKDVTASSKKKK